MTNDWYAHAAGDKALRLVATILADCARETDAFFGWVARRATDAIVEQWRLLDRASNVIVG
ncbi:MAG: hypothetical protein ABJB12_14300 [Pseudomonadota bacterium]